jgi:hypothetical protein
MSLSERQMTKAQEPPEIKEERSLVTLTLLSSAHQTSRPVTLPLLAVCSNGVCRIAKSHTTRSVPREDEIEGEQVLGHEWV